MLNELEERYGIRNVFAYADDLVVLIPYKRRK